MTDRNTLAICATRARKILAYTTVGGFFASRSSANMKGVYGRSMIEMLGVLAIIGVLSAGGVWGYSVAMENYKVNKLIDDFDRFSVNMMNLYGIKPPKNAARRYVSPEALCNAGIVEGKYCQGKTPFNTQTEFGIYETHNGITMTDKNSKSITCRKPDMMFILAFYERFDLSACIKLLTQPKWKNASEYTVVLGYGGATQLPISTEEAKNTCTHNVQSIIFFSLVFMPKEYAHCVASS